MVEKTLPAVTAANYFDPEIEQAYMGSTQFKNFLKCEAAALAMVRGTYKPETTPSMLVGSYVDAHFSGTLPLFQDQHPELYKRDGSLKAEYQRANEIITRMEEDELYMLLLSGKRQVIRTGEIAGVPFKIKIDCMLDTNTCHEIVRRFPGAEAALGFCDGAIVDQKVMRDTANIWSEEEHERVSFVRAWGYDLQGAIYQAVEGHFLPFILAVGTKEDPPDLLATYIPDDDLTAALRQVEDLAPRFQAIKDGAEQPRRCGKCAYCRATRKLDSIIDYAEYAAQD